MASVNDGERDQPSTMARYAMVRDQLQARGITDVRVLQAVRDVPRHHFVATAFRDEAYDDRPLPIGQEQTISQPYMVACMLQALAVQPEDMILEIGTGSGYQTALLSRLAALVYSIEYFATLAREAERRLADLGGANIRLMVGDGSLGLPQYAPYNGIIVAAGAPHIPEALRHQLAEGGRLVVPVGDIQEQQLVVLTRHGDTYSETRSFHCRFVPLLGAGGWDEEERSRFDP